MSSISSGVRGFLTNEEHTALRQGDFEIHCLQMKLERGSAGGRLFIGPGVIRQGSDGRLHFTLYAKEGLSFSEFVRDVSGPGNVEAGRIIPDEEYYRLSATDTAGREWICEQVLPSTNTSHGGTICNGELAEITNATEPPVPVTKEHLFLDVFEDLSIPFNTRTVISKTVAGRELTSTSLNTLKFETDCFDLLLEKETGSLQIAVGAKNTQFVDHFEMRVMEALQFALARPVYWSVMIKQTARMWEIRIRPSRSERAQSRIGPPVAVEPDTTESFCKLFDSYLKYVLARQSDDKLHPISAQMRAICHASMGAIEAEALVVSIAIETILEHVHASKYVLSPEDKEWVERAKRHFETWGGPDVLSNRIVGLFSMLNTPSASMRLSELIELEVITREQKHAWGRLRHKLAHGETIGTIPLQDFIDLTNTVLVLFYHLVFYAIGYRGKYTDYSSPSWPTKVYEVPSASSEVSIL